MVELAEDYIEFHKDEIILHGILNPPPGGSVIFLEEGVGPFLPIPVWN